MMSAGGVLVVTIFGEGLLARSVVPVGCSVRGVGRPGVRGVGLPGVRIEAGVNHTHHRVGLAPWGRGVSCGVVVVVAWAIGARAAARLDEGRGHEQCGRRGGDRSAASESGDGHDPRGGGAEPDVPVGIMKLANAQALVRSRAQQRAGFGLGPRREIVHHLVAALA